MESDCVMTATRSVKAATCRGYNSAMDSSGMGIQVGRFLAS